MRKIFRHRTTTFRRCVETWADHGFACVDPVATLDDFLGEMAARQRWMPVERFRHEPAENRDYIVNAHWALYVEIISRASTFRSCTLR